MSCGALDVGSTGICTEWAWLAYTYTAQASRPLAPAAARTQKSELCSDASTHDPMADTGVW